MANVHAYFVISASILLLSCILSGLELLSIKNSFLNFVLPGTKIKHKNKLWVYINSSQVILSIAAAISLFNNYHIAFAALIVLITAINLYIYKARKVGKDGSDQLRVLALLSCSLCLLSNVESAELIAMCFWGGQILIGYATSGIVKLLSPHWQTGLVLSGILGTYSYGVADVALFLKKHPAIERFCCYSAIFSMLSVPLCFLIPDNTFLVLSLVIMGCFHLSTAILMGLNDFLFTFPLGYPGVIALHYLVYGQ